MKIIITGAGAVGYHLAKMLSSESQDIYVVDENQERLNYVQSHLDIYAIHGDAKLPSVLQEAKVNPTTPIRRNIFFMTAIFCRLIFI